MPWYEKEVWKDDDPRYPGSAARVGHLDEGITLVESGAQAAIAAAAADTTSQLTLVQQQAVANLATVTARIVALEQLVQQVGGEAKPAATTEAATGATATSATLNATIIPNGSAGVVFVWGANFKETTVVTGTFTGTSPIKVSAPITGTLTSSTEFKVRVTTSAGTTEGLPLQLGTLTSAPVITLPSGTIEGTVGVAFSAVVTLTNATGGSIANLPVGLTAVYSTGKLTISGTPTTSLAYSPTVTATGAGGTSTLPFSFPIKAAVTSSVVPVVIPSSGSTPIAVTVNGSSIVFKGTTVWGMKDHITLAFGEEQYNERVKIVNNLAAAPWKVNCVRLRVLAFDYEEQTYMTKATYVQQIKNWVELFAAAKIYVFVCSWDPTDGKSGFTGSSWASHASYSFPLFEAIYKEVGTNPYLLWEPFNEPHEVTEAQWKANWEATIKLFRETLGYKGLLCVGPNAWSNSGWGGEGYSNTLYEAIEAYDAARTGMSSKHAIVWAKHDYWNNNGTSAWSLASWKAAVGGTQIKHAILETEFGYWNDLGGGEPYYNAAWSQAAAEAFANLASEQSTFIGGMSFVWGPWGDLNKITAADNLTPTNPWGEDVEKFMGTTVTPGPNAPVVKLNADKQTAEWPAQAGVTAWKIALSTENSLHLGRGTSYLSQAAVTGTQKFKVEVGVTYGTVTPVAGETIYMGISAEQPTAGPWSTPETEPVMPGAAPSTGKAIISMNDPNGWGPVSAQVILKAGIKGARINNGEIELLLKEGFSAAESLLITGSVAEAELAISKGIKLIEFLNEPYEPEQGPKLAEGYAGEFVNFAKALAGKGGTIIYAGYGNPWMNRGIAAQPSLKQLIGGISMHPYGEVGREVFETSGLNGEGAMEKMYAECVTLGVEHPEIYITEWGVAISQAPGKNEAGQLSYTEPFMTHVLKLSYVKYFCWFQAHDDPEGEYGCLSSSAENPQKRPVFGLLERYAKEAD